MKYNHKGGHHMKTIMSGNEAIARGAWEGGMYNNNIKGAEKWTVFLQISQAGIRPDI